MDDDINVANGIAVVYELMKFANQYVEQSAVQREPLVAIQVMLKKLLQVFGIEINLETQTQDQEIEALIKQRDAARAAKDFAMSDQIRDTLKARGVIIEDTPQGTRYRKE